MAPPARNLHLLTPGLVAELTASEAEGVRLPQLPAAERMLARGARSSTPCKDLREQLFDGFAVTGAAGVAALTHLADGGRPGDGYWLRADPVHLRADQDRLILFAGETLQLRLDEAQALCASLDAHFQDRQWHFEAPHAQRWYLQPAYVPALGTVAIEHVMGRDIHLHMPSGNDGGKWRAALNEVQMLLHDHPVNVAREARGRLPVNSVWFWGGGSLPKDARSNWRSIASDEPLARGLALCAGGTPMSAPEDFARWEAMAVAGDHLLVLTSLQQRHAEGELPSWSDAVAALERNWLAPALQALGRGTVQRIQWWPGGRSRYVLDRKATWRFWRRSKGIPIVAAVEPDQ